MRAHLLENGQKSGVNPAVFPLRSGYSAFGVALSIIYIFTFTFTLRKEGVAVTMPKSKKASKGKETELGQALAVIEKTSVERTLTPTLPALPKRISSIDDLPRVMVHQKTAKEVLAGLLVKKSQLIDPLAKALKNLRAEFKSACDPWEKTLDAVRQLLMDYEARENKRSTRIAQKQAEKALDAGKTGLAEDILVKNASTPAVSVDAVSWRTYYFARVIDAAKIPIEFNGVELRPVDERILAKLAKDPAWRVSGLPGVEFGKKKRPALL